MDSASVPVSKYLHAPFAGTPYPWGAICTSVTPPIQLKINSKLDRLWPFGVTQFFDRSILGLVLVSLVCQGYYPPDGHGNRRRYKQLCRCSASIAFLSPFPMQKAWASFEFQINWNESRSGFTESYKKMETALPIDPLNRRWFIGCAAEFYPVLHNLPSLIGMYALLSAPIAKPLIRSAFSDSLNKIHLPYLSANLLLTDSKPTDS